MGVGLHSRHDNCHSPTPDRTCGRRAAAAGTREHEPGHRPMKKNLSLESLTVETFATEGPGDVARAAIRAPSRSYSECLSCGIACTAFLCI